MAHHSLPVDPTVRPRSFNFATDIVDYWANKSSSQIALHWIDQSLSTEKKFSYQHFSQQSHRIANLLTFHGVKQGDTCILILPRLPQWWEVATACLRSGIVMCPCTTLLVDKDIEYRIKVSNATVFVGDKVAVDKVLKIRKNCPSLRTILQIGGEAPSGSDVVAFETALSKVSKNAHFDTPKSLKPVSPALIFFTSGTTGPPKMVLHTQISYPLAHGLTGVHWLKLDRSSVYWNLSEQGWAKAAWSFFSTWNCGATLFVHDDRQAFDPKRTLAVLAKYPVTTLCAPPTVYRQLVLDENRELFQTPGLKALKHACGAGEPLNAHVIERWKDSTGMEIYDGYGQTETILTCANQAANPVRYGSMGKPIPGVPLFVIDENGEETQIDKEGDIAIQVQDKETAFFGIFTGYIDMKSGHLDRRLKKFRNGKQYYLTGDRATRDTNGYFWFVGRNDDVINSSGYRIGEYTVLLTVLICLTLILLGPFEVESTLKLHPAVVESAVVAAPDPDRDEVVKAFVVLTNSAAKSISGSDEKRDKLIKDLQGFCKENAAPYKYPRKIQFVDSSFLPKTISGKIKRAELKKMEKDKYKESQKGNKAKL